MQKRTEAKRINVLDKRVFELAKKQPDIMPEPFLALEEYDRTGKLLINFTLDPALYQEYKKYCEKSGRKMSSLIEITMRKQLRQRIFK